MSPDNVRNDIKVVMALERSTLSLMKIQIAVIGVQDRKWVQLDC